MTKKEILGAFDNVITQLADALDKQTTLNAYVKVEAKIEAYRDAQMLIANALPDDEATSTSEADTEAPTETKPKAAKK